MSEPTVEGFFDNAVRSGAPSIKLKEIGDFVHGEIVEQFIVDAKKFGTDEVELDRVTGQPVKQLVVIVQTELRNWAQVSKVPRVDPTDRNSAEKPGSEDDGKRAVYIKPFTNIHAAVGKAVVEATGKKGPLLDGGTLGVKIIDLEDTNKGNPLKKHAAVYTPPTASGGDFFGESNTAAPQPAPQAQPAAPAAPPQPAPVERTSEPPF